MRELSERASTQASAAWGSGLLRRLQRRDSLVGAGSAASVRGREDRQPVTASGRHVAPLDPRPSLKTFGWPWKNSQIDPAGYLQAAVRGRAPGCLLKQSVAGFLREKSDTRSLDQRATRLSPCTNNNHDTNENNKNVIHQCTRVQRGCPPALLDWTVTS